MEYKRLESPDLCWFCWVHVHSTRSVLEIKWLTNSNAFVHSLKASQTHNWTTVKS